MANQSPMPDYNLIRSWLIQSWWQRYFPCLSPYQVQMWAIKRKERIRSLRLHWLERRRIRSNPFETYILEGRVDGCWEESGGWKKLSPSAVIQTQDVVSDHPFKHKRKWLEVNLHNWWTKHVSSQHYLAHEDFFKSDSPVLMKTFDCLIMRKFPNLLFKTKLCKILNLLKTARDQMKGINTNYIGATDSFSSASHFLCINASWFLTKKKPHPEILCWCEIIR